MTFKTAKSEWSKPDENEKSVIQVISVGQLVFRFVAVDSDRYKVEVFDNRDRSKANLFAEFTARRDSSIKTVCIPSASPVHISL